jgi:putative flippase GtrA
VDPDTSRAAAIAVLLRPLGRFAGLGAASFVLTMGVTALLREVVGVPAEGAAAVALATALLANFLACRFFVFAGGGGPMAPQLVAFAASSLAFRGAEYGAFLVLLGPLSVPYLAALAVVLVVSFLVKFVYYRWMFSLGRGRGRR